RPSIRRDERIASSCLSRMTVCRGRDTGELTYLRHKLAAALCRKSGRPASPLGGFSDQPGLAATIVGPPLPAPTISWDRIYDYHPREREIAATTLTSGTILIANFKAPKPWGFSQADLVFLAPVKLKLCETTLRQCDQGGAMVKKSIAVVVAIVLATPLAAEPITLKLNSPAPPWSFVNKEVLGPWAEAVTAHSDGTLKVQTFFGGTLGTFGNSYDRVIDHVVDIAFILTAFAAGKIRQQDVAALPFEAENSVLASMALWTIYQEGLTAKELDAVKPLALW